MKMVLDGILIAMHANKQTPDKSTPASQKATQAVPAARSMTGLAAWIWIGSWPGVQEGLLSKVTGSRTAGRCVFLVYRLLDVVQRRRKHLNILS